jgi:uncharacterized SAM-binding protein YcdF (DUF218 family)
MFYPRSRASGRPAVPDYPAVVHSGGGNGRVAVSSKTERSCGPLGARCFKSGSLSLEVRSQDTDVGAGFIPALAMALVGGDKPRPYIEALMSDAGSLNKTNKTV